MYATCMKDAVTVDISRDNTGNRRQVQKIKIINEKSGLQTGSTQGACFAKLTYL